MGSLIHFIKENVKQDHQRRSVEANRCDENRLQGQISNKLLSSKLLLRITIHKKISVSLDKSDSQTSQEPTSSSASLPIKNTPIKSSKLVSPLMSPILITSRNSTRTRSLLRDGPRSTTCSLPPTPLLRKSQLLLVDQFSQESVSSQHQSPTLSHLSRRSMTSRPPSSGNSRKSPT